MLFYNYSIIKTSHRKTNLEEQNKSEKKKSGIKKNNFYLKILFQSLRI